MLCYLFYVTVLEDVYSCVAVHNIWTLSFNFSVHESKFIVLVFFFNFLRAGVLACLDGYMNIALEQTEEYVNGQLKNKYGDAFIRGNNGNVLH